MWIYGESARGLVFQLLSDRRTVGIHHVLTIQTSGRTNERMNKLPGVRICRAMQRAGSDRGHKPRWEGSVEGYRKSDGESDGVKRGEMSSE